MSKIAFFCIPAHGHTNPTLGVVKELIQQGHEVWYYSYDIMKDKIESTGAHYISCDKYDNQMNLKPEDADRVGKDIVFSTELIVNTTLAMDEAILQELAAWKPDVVVADSVATWGKLAALKLQIPFVSSTTTFAFNKHSAKVMKQMPSGLLSMLFSMKKANKVVARLSEKGYPVNNVLSMIQNDNETNTIVYTSPEFQPCSETFSDKYVFVGPSIRLLDYEVKKPKQTTIYISMGTVNNQQTSFFQNCIEALKDSDYHVIMSIGELVDPAALGSLPDNFTVKPSVNQMEVLQQADVFLTHCGMNSVNEALYYEVPLVLFPQTNEQRGVANRVAQLGAGRMLKAGSAKIIRSTVEEVLSDNHYKKEAIAISKGFKACGGAKQAAQFILDNAKPATQDCQEM